MFTLKTTLIILCTAWTINAYEILKLKNPTTKYGFVYPNRAEPNSNVTYVLEGVDVLIYLAKVPENYAECKITTQDAEVTYSLVPNGDDKSSKVAFWTPDSKSTGCGARIKNVKVSDSGRWRLKAVSEEEDHLYQSFINLKVIKNFDRLDGDFIIREGMNDEFNMTEYASYCEISEPALNEEHNIFDKCQVDLEHINKLYATKWKARVGVLGKVDEIILHPKVEVQGEYFDVGYNKTGTKQNEKINLYCNLKYAVDVAVTFCRFIRNGSDVGLRLSEGLSNGQYSYFGQQLKDGDCGVTIEHPKVEDYEIWKCSVGIHRRVNKTETKFEIKEAIISLIGGTERSEKATESESVTLQEVLAGFENPLELKYTTNFPIKYCIIKHPNGTQYAINQRFQNGNWSTRGKINLGECEMILFNATDNEAGEWQMQIGHLETQFMDKIIHIPVRVGQKSLVAVTKSITAEEDSQITIKCKAVTKPGILEYCRFTLPDGNGFQVDVHSSNDNPIDGLYWYNGTSLKEGDCQVTINKISSKHYGTWRCSGKIEGSKHLEDFDVIHIDSEQLSAASIGGIAAGAAVLLIGSVGGFIYYRKKKRQQTQRRPTILSTHSSQSEVSVFPVGENQPELVEEIEMDTVSHAQSRTSMHSKPSTSRQSRPSTAQSLSAHSVHSAISAHSIPPTAAQSRHSSVSQQDISEL